MKKETGVRSTDAATKKDRHSRPENKDNLDHRQNEEQDNKGEAVTHNRKDVKSKKPSTHGRG